MVLFNLLNTFFEISLSCSAVILLTMLFRKLTSAHYSARWRYYVWLLLAVRMVLPFHITTIEVPSILPSARTNEQPVSDADTILQQTASKTNLPDAAHGNQIKATLSGEQMSSQNSTLHKSVKETLPTFITPFGMLIYLFLPVLWITGMILFLLYHTLTYVSFQKKLKRWKVPLTHEETEEILTKLLEEMKIKNNIKAAVCKNVSSPMVVGILRPQIILPSEDFSAAQLKIIFKHELTHYQHHDLYFKFLLLSVNAIHWFNPLVYFMVKSADFDMEILCDEAVLQKETQEYRKIYSYTILQTLVWKSKNKTLAFSTCFNGGKNSLKHRFSQIMNGTPRKSGIAFFSLLLCLILLSSNLIAFGKENNTANKSTLNTFTDTIQSKVSEQLKLTKASHILLVGTDESLSEQTHADSIILVTIQPESKIITFTSFLRDMLVTVPNGGKERLSLILSKGDMDLLKKSLKETFDIPIDGYISVNFDGFENIIDKLGGIELTLTKAEATYLNGTNYISKRSNRTVEAGINTMNGNQVLGYSRIRKVVENIPGKNGDWGRCQRQRNVLSALFEKYNSSNLNTLMSMLKTILVYCTTDIKEDQFLSYLNTFSSDYKIKHMEIPANEAFEDTKTEKYGFVILPDIKANKEVLKGISKP